MSGFLGQLAGEVMGGVGGGGGTKQAALGGVMQEALTQFGGVPGLVNAFEQAGLGQHVQSWIGNGQNLPVSAQQIQQVFSSPTVEGWAQRVGVPPQTMLGLLSQVLPQAVDHVSPDGTAPQSPGQAAAAQVPDPGPDAAQAPGGFNLGGLMGKLFGG